MSIRALIEQIATGWGTYKSKERVDKTDPIYEAVTRNFPNELRALVEASPETALAQGSTGAGNITAAPWIALFDTRITTSATKGYYVVYLFAADLSAVTLSLAFGTTQFEEQFGGVALSFPRMRLAAGRLQEMFDHLIPADLHRGPIDLAAAPRQKLHFAYEQAAILSYSPYAVRALPPEENLARDFRTLVSLYRSFVSDPLEATVERLVEAVIEPADRVDSIEVSDFAIRPPRKVRGTGNGARLARRYSPESRKVGDAGERIVVNYEKSRLARLGRQDLASRVRWHANERDCVGWDITSFDDNGLEIYIEVKSSAGRSVSSVDMTANEWRAACHLARKNRYFIYLVTNALSAYPSIVRLQNPASHVDKGNLFCQPLIYHLELSQVDSEAD